MLRAALLLVAMGVAPAAAAQPPSAPVPASTPAPASPQAHADKRVVLLLPLSAMGLKADVVRNLEDYLRRSIATLPAVRVVPAAELQITLSDPKNASQASCPGGPECAVAWGKLTSAQVVVFGSLAALGDVFSLDLRARDVASGKELAKERCMISGSRDGLIPEVRLAAYRLLAPERLKGSLLLVTTLTGVEIEIDGVPVGTTPLPGPIEDLTPGKHLVAGKRQGYAPLEQEVEIKPLQMTRLKLEDGGGVAP